MYKNNKIAVVIAAAGSGKRMGSGIPKQYLTIGGVPILIKTVEAFLKNEGIDTVLVVAGKDHLDYCREQLSQYGMDRVQVVLGGAQRQDSVYRGLCAMPKDTDYVLIHDGARPHVSQKTIDDIIEVAVQKGAAVAAVPVKDTVIRRPAGLVESSLEYLDRTHVFSVQTPQAFEKNLILQAFEAAFAEDFYGTDDGMLVERIGHGVQVVPGTYANIKITTKEDLPMENRVGSGYDVHRLVADKKLIIGGVEIPFEMGLLGHSDADVLVHAIMDALLGAAGLGDIGRLFPDDSPKYKGISSLTLLKRVGEKLSAAGYGTGNIDATLICQRPKMSPYVEEMRINIARTLEIEVSRINIKATTTEGLGFTGREEGIGAEAVCLLYK